MSRSEQKVKQLQHENQIKENKIIGKPYQSINIGPINNNFLIPTKIKSPFDDEVDQIEQDIKNIIDPYFSKNPPNSFPIQDLPLLSIYVSSEKREIICDYISKNIANYASICSQDLISLTQEASIISKCVEIISSILNFSIFFQFIQLDKPFSEILYHTLHTQLFNNNNFMNLLTSIVSEIFTNSLKENRSLIRDEQYIILFIENANLFTDYFMNTVKQNISAIFKEIMNQGNPNDKNDMKNKYCYSFKLFHNLYHSIPKTAVNFLKLISKIFTTEVIRQNVDFIASVGEVVFYNQDQIDSFFAIISPTTRITDYTAFVKSMISDGIDMDKMVNLHRFIGKQSIHMRHIVERFLKKRLNTNEKQAIISFTNLIDQEFRAGKYSPNIILELSLIQDKYGFESVHSSLMMRRAIDTDFELDKRFAEEHKEFYNDNHSENFMQIVKDVEESHSIFQNFLKEKKDIPSFLSIFVFFWQHWIIDDYAKYQFPKLILPHLTSFALFMRGKYPKKQLTWHLAASDCKLKLGRFSISCNGVTGAILLALNDSPKTVKQLNKILNTNIDPEPFLSQFLEAKGGKIIVRYIENGEMLYKINKNIDIHNGDEVKISTLLPIPKEASKDQNMHMLLPDEANKTKNMRMNLFNIISKTNQIDGLIMSSLKQKEMTKEQILSKIQKLVTFPIEENIVQERIDRLERRNFISYNPNDNLFQYVP